MRIRYWIIPFVLLAAPAQAAWYQVEAIVFDRHFPNADGELWDGKPGLPKSKNSVNLVAPTLDSNNFIPYQILPFEKYRLRSVYHALEKSRNNRPLLHVAWRQPAVSRDNTRAVHLFKFSDTVGEIEDLVSLDPLKTVINGFVKISSAHFLYVDIDLVYFLDDGLFIMPAANDKWPLGDDLGDHGNQYPDYQATYVRLNTTRKIKLEELHYFDHPLFGVILQVSRLKQ